MKTDMCTALSGTCLVGVFAWSFGDGAKAGTADPHVVPFILGSIIFALWAIAFKELK